MTVTFKPRWANRQAIEHPMMPPPAMRTSGITTPSYTGNDFVTECKNVTRFSKRLDRIP
jgi:hypothetical protein